MKKGTKELLRTCGIALVFMVALPAAFRVWMAFHPPPPKEPLSALPSVFDPATIRLERVKRLLLKPLAKWTNTDRTAEPALAEWLAAHEKIVLPWEWSEAARTKDDAGFRKAWYKILTGECKLLEDICEDIHKQTKTLNDNTDCSHVLYSHATNELVRLTAIFATNAYPSSVEKVVLSKGLLWGWNRNQERVELPDAQSANALLDSLRSEAAGLLKTINDNGQVLKVLAEHEGRFSKQLSDLEKIRDAWQKDDETPPSELQVDALKAIISSIHANAVWRKSESTTGAHTPSNHDSQGR